MLFVRALARAAGRALVFSALAACSSTHVAPLPDDAAAADAGAGEDAAGDGAAPDASGGAQSKIQHLVVIVQENHTFDAYFGKYCTAPTGTNPTCTAGPACCEAGPDKDPSGASPIVLDDQANAARDPFHDRECELQEINGGKMDQFVTGAGCASAQNFAYADPAAVKVYRDLAAGGALADRYFQPIAGQSSANDMYFARAAYVFDDNDFQPPTIGSACERDIPTKAFTDQTIADLLVAKGISWAWYGEGYKYLLDAHGGCPDAPPGCGLPVNTYPCLYSPGDVPFQYYPNLADKPQYMRDYADLANDLAAGTLPSVVFVKPLGFRSEHPGYGTTISAGATFVKSTIDAISASAAASSTLVLVAYDEGGGFFDHVSPPPAAAADNEPYGTRLPFIAVGPFAKKNEVSHVTMEHSSVVKFIEWNWLGATGQLGTRDKDVNNIGSLLDPAATGTPVPAN